ncbi:hypothetical protein Tco_0619558 [Tanacetum coccineum]
MLGASCYTKEGYMVTFVFVYPFCSLTLGDQASICSDSFLPSILLLVVIIITVVIVVVILIVFVVVIVGVVIVLAIIVVVVVVGGVSSILKLSFVPPGDWFTSKWSSISTNELSNLAQIEYQWISLLCGGVVTNGDEFPLRSEDTGMGDSTRLSVLVVKYPRGGKEILGIVGPGASIRRHTGSYYPKRYWELLPKEILGAITQRDNGSYYPKRDWNVLWEKWR